MDSHLDKVKGEVGSSSARELSFNVEDYTFSLTNARFSVIISKNHVGLQIPSNMQQHLPNMKVPAKVQCCKNIWEMSYSGDPEYRVIKPKGWQKFVGDNELQIGNAVFFELLNANEREILFKSVLLKIDHSTRTTLPAA